MSQIKRFAAYAAAFEKTFETDDFSHIEPFFSEDAVYEIRGGGPLDSVAEGRSASFASLKNSLESLDRLFDTRELELVEGPTENGDEVWFRWAGTYGKAGLPDLRIAGEETVTYRGDLICRMLDAFGPEAAKSVTRYMAEHASELGLAEPS